MHQTKVHVFDSSGIGVKLTIFVIKLKHLVVTHINIEAYNLINLEVIVLKITIT